MNKVIDVILPLFNAEDTIADALESLRGQSYPAWECIIINDGSTDKTLEILSDFKRRDSRFKIIRIPHSGIVKALNTGLEISSAPYIARMDADDISLPERFAKQIDFLQKNPEIDVVSCLVEHNPIHENQKGFAHYVDWTNQIITPQDHFINRFVESPIVHPTVMFRKELIENFGGYSQNNVTEISNFDNAKNCPEDYELWLRWMQKGVSFAKIPEKLFHWTDRTDRLSRTHKFYSTEAFYECKTFYLVSGPLKRCKKVGICGAGRLTRKRAELLTNYGKEIIFYVDIDPRKIGQKIHKRPVIPVEEIEKMPDVPLISYLGSRGAREDIRNRLKGSKYIEGKNFWCAA